MKKTLFIDTGILYPVCNIDTQLPGGTMNRLFSLVTAAVLLATLFACSSAKPPTTAAAEGSKVIATLNDLSTFYGKKSLPDFMNLIAPDYQDRKGFSAALESVFSRYDTVHFTVQYTRMYITIMDKGKAKATFNWDSSWESKGGGIQKNTGRATFVFEPKGGALLSIDGTNPFLPQTIETQGKP